MKSIGWLAAIAFLFWSMVFLYVGPSKLPYVAAAHAVTMFCFGLTIAMLALALCLSGKGRL